LKKMSVADFFFQLDWEGGYPDLAIYGLSPKKISNKRLANLWKEYRDQYKVLDNIANRLDDLRSAVHHQRYRKRGTRLVDFLQKLRELNVERCERYFFHLRAWNALEWAGAAAGEAGEAANVASKMRRHEVLYDVGNGTYNPSEMAKYRKQLAEEVADTIIYLDLLCASQDIDLEEAIRAKFNKVSEEHGFEKQL